MYEVRSIQLFSLVLFVLCVVISGLFVWHFSKKNYSPVEELLNIFKSSIHDKMGMKVAIDGKTSRGSEYAQIKESILKTFEEKKKSDKIIMQYNSEMKSSKVSRLLKGQIIKNNTQDDVMNIIEEDISLEEFSILLYYIDKSNKFANEEPELTRFIIRNVVEELARQKNKGIVIEIDGFVACIISFLNKESIKDREEELIRIAQFSMDFISSHFQIQLVVAASGIHKGSNEITEAYNHAMEAMEYKLIENRSKIILYDNLKQYSKNYYYPIEIEQQFIMAIMAGDFILANQISDDLFEKNIKKNVLSATIARYFMIHLSNTVLKAAKMLEGSPNDIVAAVIEDIEKLMGCSDILEMKSLIINSIALICNYVEIRKRSQNNTLRQEVIKYIIDNQGNVNLSTSAIAEKFKMNPINLSRFFREQTGDSISDYISKIRIQRSKTLLKEGKLALHELSDKVGFSHINTFIRTFKKYEGITPGKYREIN